MYESYRIIKDIGMVPLIRPVRLHKYKIIRIFRTWKYPPQHGLSIAEYPLARQYGKQSRPNNRAYRI